MFTTERRATEIGATAKTCSFGMRSPLNVSGCIPVSTRMRPSVLLLAALLAGAMSIDVSAQEIRIDPWKAADQTKVSGAADASRIAPAIASDASSSAAGTLAALFDTPCADGFAGPFPCQNVDLLAFLPIDSIGGVRNPEGELLTSLNDIWGWTDPETGREYALVGRSDGTSLDRKSTRLNSSHVKTSYAVFCLK